MFLDSGQGLNSKKIRLKETPDGLQIETEPIIPSNSGPVSLIGDTKVPPAWVYNQFGITAIKYEQYASFTREETERDPLDSFYHDMQDYITQSINAIRQFFKENDTEHLILTGKPGTMKSTVMDSLCLESGY